MYIINIFFLIILEQYLMSLSSSEIEIEYNVRGLNSSDPNAKKILLNH